jgi:beta-galactosidase
MWAWEALAHGADVVSFFRWRQAPFAQEQMHAGLNRPDNVLDVGGHEAAAVANELKSDWWQAVASSAAAPSQVALVFDYEAAWMHEIQPQGRSFGYLALVFAWYTALRRCGVDIDIVPPGADLTAYKAVFVPSLPWVSSKAMEAFSACKATIVFGVRTGAKTESFTIPSGLPPGALRTLLPMRISRVESLRPGVTRNVVWGNNVHACTHWAETVETAGEIDVIARFDGGSPALLRSGQAYYLATWPTRELCLDVVKHALDEAGVPVTLLHEDVRLRRRGNITFAFNFGPDSQAMPFGVTGECVLGAHLLAPRNFSAWKS